MHAVRLGGGPLRGAARHRREPPRLVRLCAPPCLPCVCVTCAGALQYLLIPSEVILHTCPYPVTVRHQTPKTVRAVVTRGAWLCVVLARRRSPIVDGVELSEAPVDSLAAGRFAVNVTVLLGTNADEGSEFVGLDYDASFEEAEAAM